MGSSDITKEVAAATVAAVRAGDVAALSGLLDAHAGLASARLRGVGGRTALHIATDWPGYWPNAPETVRMLIAAGAEVDVRGRDGTGETPLHWAASSDDVDVARVLIDAGADVDAPDGSIGTPLANAVGYSCWHVAALLVQRGARVDALWIAAAVGDLDRLEELLGTLADDGAAAISQAFWHACAAGRRRAAERLLHAGADLHWSPDYAERTTLDAARKHGEQRTNVITWLEGLETTRSDDEGA